MDPNNQNPQPQTPSPGQSSPSGSDWQKEAVTAARISMQPRTPPPAPDVPPQIPGVPDWQQGFQQHQPPAQPDVPDVLAAADPIPPPPPSAPAQYIPQPPPTTPPLPGNAVGQPVVFGDFGAAPSAAPLPQPAAASKPLPAKKLLLWGGVGLAVLTVAAVALAIFLGGNGNKSIKDANSKSNSLSNAIDMSILNDVSFAAPKNLDGYTYDSAASIDTFATYLNSTKTCAFGFGTLPPNTFSGNTVEEMVDAQIQNLRNAGATADGPDAGEPLVLKTPDGKTSYKMPTLNFTFSKGSATGKVHYSIVILKNKRLAIVNRQCGNENGPVTDSDMNGLDSRARGLQVQVGETAN